jgi:hypothetical protein
MTSEPVIKRLTLSRFLFELALQNANSQLETADAACIHLLQDAIEVFLLAAFDHLDITVAGRTDFPQYLDKLTEKLNYDLPYRRRLLEINRVRVHSKHEGIPPNRKEVSGYVTDARRFLEQTCEKVFAVDFWTISLVELLDEGAQKTLLREAEKVFSEQKYLDCMIECRKAFYLAFESDYDIKKDLENAVGLLFGSRAPYYARNKKYAEKSVKTPFDYIVLDHSGIDAELMKEGIDNTTFWNVWRLTPQVYRHAEGDQWLVKHELAKQESDGIQDRAAYVLSAVVSMLLARQANRTKMRSNPRDAYSHDVKLKRKGVVMYQKADKNGPVSGTVPDDLEIVHTDYATDGLNDGESYWSVFCFRKKTDKEPFFLLSGFVLQDDLDLGE